jgi:hypothetical protein
VEEWEHFGEMLGYTTTAFAGVLGMTPDGARKAIAAWAASHPDDPRPGTFERAWTRDHPPNVPWLLAS